jgi:hypothetical protein
VGGSKIQVSKAMLQDEFCKLKNRVCLGAQGLGELLRDLIMNTRCTISRISPIQGLISGWFRLWGMREECMLKNKNYHYFGC